MESPIGRPRLRIVRPGELPPAAALVATRFSRTAIALPIAWHAVTLARSWHARKRETPLWLALDVVGLSWSLLPVGKRVGRILWKLF